MARIKEAVFTLIILLTLCSFSECQNQQDTVVKEPKILLDGHKVIRVTPLTRKHLVLLNNLLEQEDGFNIDFWIEPATVNSSVDIHLSPEYYLRVTLNLTRAGMTFTVQISNLQSALDKQNPGARMAGGFDYHKYHSFSEIEAEISRLADKYPNLAQKFSVGKSYLGKEQWAIKIQAKGGLHRKTFFVHCGIHAREWVTQATCMYIINKMLSNYGSDSSVTSLLDKMNWIIMPVFNPDGYIYSWTSNRMWRKTRSHNSGSNCVGADPNRNWGYRWGGVGTSSNPCSDTYPGTKPFSEVETLNVAKYLYKHHHDMIGYMDIHAYSQLWMTPWGFKRDYPRDYQEMERVSRIGIDALRRAGYGTYYKVGPSSVIIYATSGASTDWVHGVLGVKYSFALELRDTGRYGFALPASLIVPTARETFAGITAMGNAIKV